MELVGLWGVSRQAAASHLRALVASGLLVKEGSTRGAVYHLPSRAGKVPTVTVFRRVCSLKGLEEHVVYEAAREKLALRRALSRSASAVVEYAFTEMLNNAIDHSKASRACVAVTLDTVNFRFSIEDKGIGVFESIRRKWDFPDHFEAARHLLKGKVTTDPSRHSGQGIFFTSKIADEFILESDRLRLFVVNRADPEVYWEDRRRLKGTRVVFSLKRRSRKDLKKLFDSFTNEDFEFDRTVVTVRLSSGTEGRVSRSEARRLLFGLDKFRRIRLDFRGLTGIGQGFADEIFRVFAMRHPEILLEAHNAGPSVAHMIAIAKKSLQ
ncbi:MAG: DUF4325 domain-containing protein [Candidatus Hydrogenedentota bacterium]